VTDATGFVARLGDRAPITCPDTPLMLIGRAPRADGSYGRPAPDAPLPRDPSDASLWQPGQGQANACGTTTLAYILEYLLGGGAPTRDRIDDSLRRGNIFSAPLLLVSYVRRLGLAARAYNDASLDLIFGLADRGIPVMLLADTTPLDLRDTANLHWVALVAHCGDRVGIYNPHGFQEELDLASFRDHWRQARIFGLPAWRNFCIAIARDPSALPPPRRPALSAVSANLAANGLAGVVNGVLGLRRPPPGAGARHVALRVPRGAAAVLGSAAQTALGGGLLLAAAAPSGLGSLARLIRRR
jgi:hypothetical protein